MPKNFLYLLVLKIGDKKIEVIFDLSDDSNEILSEYFPKSPICKHLSKASKEELFLKY